MVPKSKTHNKNSKMLVTSLSSSHQEDLGGSAALDIVRYYCAYEQVTMNVKL